MFVSLCAEVSGAGGAPALVPLVARAVRLPAPAPEPAGSGSPGSGSVTAVLPVTLPTGVLLSDMAVLLMHKRALVRAACHLPSKYQANKVWAV